MSSPISLPTLADLEKGGALGRLVGQAIGMVEGGLGALAVVETAMPDWVGGASAGGWGWGWDGGCSGHARSSGHALARPWRGRGQKRGRVLAEKQDES